MTTGSAASLNGLLALDPISMESISIPPTAARPVAAAATPRGRILVFEDETVVALDLQRTLRDAGFRVVGPATSPEEAKALTARGRIDCAVIDRDAADDGGLAVADALAEAGIPFVLLTARREAVPARHAARPVLEKPCASAQLLDAVQVALRPAVAAADDGVVYPLASAPISFPRILPQL